MYLSHQLLPFLSILAVLAFHKLLAPTKTDDSSMDQRGNLMYHQIKGNLGLSTKERCLQHVWQNVTPISSSYSSHSHFCFSLWKKQCFRWVSYLRSTYADLQQHHLLFLCGAIVQEAHWKQQNSNRFVTSHVLYVCASLYMSKKPIGSRWFWDFSRAHRTPCEYSLCVLADVLAFDSFCCIGGNT